MVEKVENLKSISLRADYKIENLSCCHDNLDLWEDFKHDSRFKFCPFCAREIYRTITIKENSVIGYNCGGRK